VTWCCKQTTVFFFPKTCATWAFSGIHKRWTMWIQYRLLDNDLQWQWPTPVAIDDGHHCGESPFLAVASFWPYNSSYATPSEIDLQTLSDWRCTMIWMTLWSANTLDWTRLWTNTSKILKITCWRSFHAI
jgi:hypothetical protein